MQTLTINNSFFNWFLYLQWYLSTIVVIILIHSNYIVLLYFLKYFMQVIVSAILFYTN